MPYLRLKDYLPFIQADQLTQVVRADDSIRLQAEIGAQAKITEYLVQKYDLADQFRNTLIYNFAKNYQAGQLIDLNFTPYSATSLYAVNDLVLNAGLSYICKTAITVAEAFTVSKWTLLGSQYDLFYIPFPYPEFNYQNNYSIGDKIFHKGKVYKALQPSFLTDNSQKLKYSSNTTNVYSNTFPDASSNTAQWGVGVAYNFTGLTPISVPGDFTAWSSVTIYTTGQRISYNSTIWQALANSTNIAPDTDITKWQPVSWVSGDNRNSNIIEIYIDCTLYKLHKGIAPRNIPDLRVKAYDDAIATLDKYADGRITLALPKLQPITGNKIRYGGTVKKINNY